MTNFLRNISNRHFHRVDLVKPRIKGIYEGIPYNTNSFGDLRNQLNQKEFLPEDYSGNKASERSLESKKSSPEESLNHRNTKSRKSDMVKETGKILEHHQRMRADPRILPADNSHIRPDSPNVAAVNHDSKDISIKNHAEKESLSVKSDIESVEMKVLPDSGPGTKIGEFNVGKAYPATKIIIVKEDVHSKNPQLIKIKKDDLNNNAKVRSGKVKDARTGEIETGKSNVPPDDMGSSDIIFHHKQTSLNQNMPFNILERNFTQGSNQIIRVNIGQIEIKAVEAEKPVINKPVTGFSPKISLSEYLKKEKKA